jgi:hypothetical protein
MPGAATADAAAGCWRASSDVLRRLACGLRCSVLPRMLLHRCLRRKRAYGCVLRARNAPADSMAGWRRGAVRLGVRHYAGFKITGRQKTGADERRRRVQRRGVITRARRCWARSRRRCCDRLGSGITLCRGETDRSSPGVADSAARASCCLLLLLLAPLSRCLVLSRGSTGRIQSAQRKSALTEKVPFSLVTAGTSQARPVR